MVTPNTEMENLRLSEDPNEREAWAARPSSSKSSEKGTEGATERPLPEHEDRDAALRSELQTVRDINNVVSGVLDSLQRAKDNMGTVSRTVNSASTLLDTWTRILSQTEHSQRLILNPSWQGASKDIADIENEALLKKQEAERKELEELQRKEALARKKEEEEHKKTRASSAVRGTRGTTRPRSRISYSAQGSARTSTRGSTTTAPTTSSGTRRPATGVTGSSGIARSRGRARGS